MDTIQNKRDLILFRAEMLLHHNKLLIEQCNSWLSEEEGLKNMEKHISKREKEKMKSRYSK